MGSTAKGPLRERAFGSVSEHVLANAHRPVLIVGPNVDKFDVTSTPTLVIGVDDSDAADAATPRDRIVATHFRWRGGSRGRGRPARRRRRCNPEGAPRLGVGSRVSSPTGPITSPGGSPTVVSPPRGRSSTAPIPPRSWTTSPPTSTTPWWWPPPPPGPPRGSTGTARPASSHGSRPDRCSSSPPDTPRRFNDEQPSPRHSELAKRASGNGGAVVAGVGSLSS